MEIEKESTRIIKKDENRDENTTTYILENGSYLSDSFDFLPKGRIDKRVTGIGATHLEITAKRHSIIVEPLKAIAASKAFEHRESKEIATIYVGSKTRLFPSPISEDDLPDRIEEYKQQNKFIKILVVADSIKYVIKSIGESGHKDFFLTVDEIDTFQADSGYRDSLEKVMDYYFKFDNACVLSATLKDFSNPELQKEPLTIFDYEKKVKNKMNIIHTYPAYKDHELARLIEKLYIKKEKILVAYNYIKGILHTISLLPDEIQERCRILCSSNSKRRVGDYFQEFEDTRGQLGSISFVTSAYFSGVDIYSSCHVICVADGNKGYTTLSVDRIRQINGRIRTNNDGTSNILSHYLVYSEIRKEPEQYRTVKQLLFYAEQTIKTLDCVKHIYSNDKDSANLLRKIRDSITKSAKIRGYNLTRFVYEENKEISLPESFSSNYRPAYFSIDALLETESTIKEIYVQYSGLENVLREYYDIGTIIKSFPDNIDNSLFDLVKIDQTQVKTKEINDALDYIITNISDDEKIKDIRNIEGMTYLQQSIFSNYNKIYEWVGKSDAIQYLRDNYIKKSTGLARRDDRAVKNIITSILFEALSSKHPVKEKLLSAFPEGELMTKAEIQRRINNIYARMDIGFGEITTERKVMNHINLFFKIKDTRRYNDNGEPVFKIHNTNPKKIKVIKEMGVNLENNPMFEGLSSSFLCSI